LRELISGYKLYNSNDVAPPKRCSPTQMPSLDFDLVSRVARLPKPTKTADALQPLFESISNSIHSLQDKFKAKVAERGLIEVLVTKKHRRHPLTITVSDNGIGLDARNYQAFTTTDTDNKLTIGGKGVGRLLWLDCFESIEVRSTYLSADKKLRERLFRFRLSRHEQIDNYSDRAVSGGTGQTGMTVIFRELRNNQYAQKFPTRLGHIFRHITSHFLPTFIGTTSPKLHVTCEDDTRIYPSEIESHIFRREDISDITSKTFGSMRLVMMECDKVASADLHGRHFVHFIAHDRTVKSQDIDAKLGFKFFGENGNHVFHACLFGSFLDKNVNQERTAFTFEDSVIDDIVNDVCMPHIKKFLAPIFEKHMSEQAKIVGKITNEYPSVAFGGVKELQDHVPLGELKDDAIYGHLSRERYRRDQRQARKIRDVFSRLRGEKIDADSFTRVVSEASRALEEAEKKSLAEYVIRRKAVLDLLELLIQKVRTSAQDSSYQREDVLHTFICPMQINNLTRGRKEIAASSHDLWILDERLTFAQYFSSDVSFDELSEAYQSTDRPDLLIFNRVHGLRQSPESAKVLLVEFKRPGRTTYNDDENPQLQIERYVKRLLSGNELDLRGRPVRLDQNAVFYCYIVADRVGRLEDWTFSWSKTADGRGRIYQPRDGFQGYIELVEWDTLIKDARERNMAFFDRAGISGESLFSSTPDDTG
jgi:hypothetical protein